MKKGINEYRYLLMASGALWIATSAGAVAQDSGALQDIIVTAQKRAESIQDVPIAISVIDADTIRASGVDAQRTLPLVTPNLHYNSTSQTVTPYLRGVGTQFASPGLESSVAVYFDDIYLARPTANQTGFYDIERVEVLRGPQGTLYGRNATGGAIRIITKKPVDRFEGNVTGTVGTRDRLELQGVLNLPVSPDAAIRLVGSFHDEDGYIHNLNGGPDLEDRHEWTLAGKFQWHVSDSVTALIAVDYTRKDDYQGLGFQPLFRTGPNQTGVALGGTIGSGFYDFSGNRPSDGSDAQKRHLKMFGLSARLDFETEAFTLSSITGYRYTHFVGQADIDATSLNYFYSYEPQEITRQHSQEFQIVSAHDGPFKYQGGVYLYHEYTGISYFLSGQIFEAALGPDGTVGGDGRVGINSFAPYGQLSYAFTPKLELSLGARYTIEEKKLKRNDYYIGQVDQHGAPIWSSLTQIGSAPKDRLKFKAFTPKVMLTYRPAQDIMIFASYGKGFKSGGFNLPDPDAGAPPEKVTNEKLEAYEIGWKTEFGNVRFNGAAFWYDIRDLQVGEIDPLAPPATRVANAGSARIKGIEADLSWAPSRHVQISAGAGYLDAKFKAYPNGVISVPCAQAPLDPGCAGGTALGLGSIPTDLSGARLPNTAKYSGFVRGAYTLPFSVEGGDLTLSAIYNYSSRINFTPDELFSRPALSLVNAYMGWRSAGERTTISLSLTNLFDEKYYITKLPINPVGGFATAGAPRQLSLGLTQAF
ncbi:MAG: TonB-dependent receptor [Sphingobium sp.]